jgi:FdhD protein
MKKEEKPPALTVWSPRSARVIERAVERRGLADSAGKRLEDRDLVVAEEPLEIRIAGESLVVTMRTPGDDLDLVAGFLFTEGLITSIADIAAMAHRGGSGEDRDNIVEVTPARDRHLSAGGARRVMRATAACGLCGKESIADIRRRMPAVADETRVSLSMVLGLPDVVRAAQPVFAATGGLHAAAVFRANGTLVAVREDVGRHNAVDKVIGHLVRQGNVPLRGTVMMFSGRAGFEIVQKAAAAQVPVLCSVSAPSSLAVDLAQEMGLTLLGFVRGASANVYTWPARIT